MRILDDEHGAPDPVDPEAEARGGWEDQHPDQYAWDADLERADYLASLSAGPWGWM